MLVKDCMTRHPVMVSPDTLASEARTIMSEQKIRHLPVIGSGKRLEGLLTRQQFALQPEVVGSLDVWDITRYLAGLQVKEIMVKAKDVYTISPDKTLERAAKIMTDRKIGSLPVIEDGIVGGIITDIDLLYAFQQMLGLPSEGVRVTIRMPDRAGEFGKLMSVLGKNGMGVMGIGTFPSPRHSGYYDAVLKIRGATSSEVETALGNIPDQEIVDLRDAI